jgi:NhaA family Na+:H+ antiporter
VHWINDGLMVVFFLLVGWRSSARWSSASCRGPPQVALPVAGALGGIALPAAIYAASPGRIPAAGRLGDPVGHRHRLRRRHRGGAGPSACRWLRLFLLTLAIVDDLAAIVIIAIFYTAKLSPCRWCSPALHRRADRAQPPRRAAHRPYLLVGVLLWLCVLSRACMPRCRASCWPSACRSWSGVRAPRARLRPWVLFFVVPLFAFANAGLDLGGSARHGPRSDRARHRGWPVPRQAARHLRRRGIADCARPGAPAGRRQLAAALRRGVCGGIGFTMSLFIGTLAFDREDQLALVRLGVLAGSLLSAVLGYAMLRFNRRKP